jgi:hypothetical protein
MKSAEQELAAIGFGSNRGEPACWRAVRLDGRVFRPAEAGPEPACSRALARWRQILARSPVASPYRISRADG